MTNQYALPSQGHHLPTSMLPEDVPAGLNPSCFLRTVLKQKLGNKRHQRSLSISYCLISLHINSTFESHY